MGSQDGGDKKKCATPAKSVPVVMARFYLSDDIVVLDDEQWNRLVNQEPLFPPEPDPVAGLEKALNYVAEQVLAERIRRIERKRAININRLLSRRREASLHASGGADRRKRTSSITSPSP